MWLTVFLCVTYQLDLQSLFMGSDLLCFSQRPGAGVVEGFKAYSVFKGNLLLLDFQGVYWSLSNSSGPVIPSHFGSFCSGEKTVCLVHPQRMEH